MACGSGVGATARAQTLQSNGAQHAATSVHGLTVTDIISMTTIGTRPRGEGDEDYDVVSPDGAQVAVVVKRGNMARNTMDYVLLVFRTAELLRSPTPDTVAQFASSSNRPGIVHLKWLPGNATLAFLGERPGELPQVYTVETRTHRLVQRTHATTVITAFDVGVTGDPVVYAAEPPRDTTRYATMRARGFVLGRRTLVSDVIAGGWNVPPWDNRAPRVLSVVRGGAVTTIPIPDAAAGYRACKIYGEVGSYLSVLKVAPTGEAALIRCTPQNPPPAWVGYRQPEFRRDADVGYVMPMDMIIDLTTGVARPLDGAPAPWGETALWAPDGRSVALGNAMQPLDGTDSATHAARATRRMLAEVDVRTGTITVIADRDSLVLLDWDPRTNAVALAPGRYELHPTETRRIYYRKMGTRWAAIPATKLSVPPVPLLVVAQGLNRSPRLVAVDPRTHQQSVVFDPTPDLRTAHRLGHEEVVHWKTKTGVTWVGGLYWPPDYVPGKRYPLLIQTHGFDSTEFWADGVFSTGEAAQPLANHGVMVLQMDMPLGGLNTPQEAPLAMAGAEGAIDYLDSLGLIDRAKVGLQGFSRTCYHTLYFLTHSRYPIAAATATDGLDMSYVQYLVFDPTYTGSIVPEETLAINGGRPAGAAFATWRERAPGFNLDHVTTPLQLTAMRANSLLGEWEPYAGLLLQGKPTELVYIPGGEHILIKPWERMTSQQGAVDWYLFWLKAEEDPDPMKVEQYTRWHHLRALQESSTTTSPAAQGH